MNSLTNINVLSFFLNRSRLGVQLFTLLFLSLLFITNPKDLSAAVTYNELHHEIIGRLKKVPEFEEIRKLADQMNLKVYLFGGAFAAYANYVNWDLLREKKEIAIANPGKFDYSYASIYTTSQDVDMVVDGNSTQAATLQAAIAKKFPYLQNGTKSVWEVRPLREQEGFKDAILSANYVNQNNDSHSMGLLQLSMQSQTAENDQIIDLHDLNASDGKAPLKLPPSFEKSIVKDVLKREINFYYDRDKHFSTSRGMSGTNPLIFAAIRYLNKAFRYDLAIPPHVMTTLKDIVNEFNPNSLVGGSNANYIKNWMIGNASKLISNSQNMERSFTILNELNLTQKILDYGSLVGITARESKSFAWWLSKAPLPSFELLKTEERGAGVVTAQDKGISIVSHETQTFEDFEKIISLDPHPNALISRNGIANEVAVHGSGFYTANGPTSGYRNNGLTIRMKLHPDAVLGRDFGLFNNGSYVLILNKKAVTLLPEENNYTILEFIRNVSNLTLHDPTNKGYLEKFKSKIRSQILVLKDQNQINWINNLVDNGAKGRSTETLIEEWISILGLDNLTPKEITAEIIKENLKLEDLLRNFGRERRVDPKVVVGIAKELAVERPDLILTILKNPSVTIPTQNFSILIQSLVSIRPDLTSTYSDLYLPILCASSEWDQIQKIVMPNYSSKKLPILATGIKVKTIFDCLYNPSFVKSNEDKEKRDVIKQAFEKSDLNLKEMVSDYLQKNQDEKSNWKTNALIDLLQAKKVKLDPNEIIFPANITFSEKILQSGPSDFLLLIINHPGFNSNLVFKDGKTLLDKILTKDLDQKILESKEIENVLNSLLVKKSPEEITKILANLLREESNLNLFNQIIHLDLKYDLSTVLSSKKDISKLDKNFIQKKAPFILSLLSRGTTPLSKDEAALAFELLSKVNIKDSNLLKKIITKIVIPKELYGRLLELAIMNNLPEVVARLLSDGEKIASKKLPNLEYPLNYASFLGREEIVRLLLSSSDIDPNKVGLTDRTPIQIAFDKKNKVIVKDIASHERVDPKSAASALFALQDEDLLVEAIQKNPKLLQSKAMKDILTYSIYKGFSGLSKELIALKSIDASDNDSNGLLPLNYSITLGKESITNELLSLKSINVSKKDKAGETALDAALKKKNRALIEKIIFHPTFDLNKEVEKIIASNDLALLKRIKEVQPDFFKNKSLLKLVSTLQSSNFVRSLKDLISGTNINVNKDVPCLQ